jgi:CDP-diglyceride synthetase
VDDGPDRREDEVTRTDVPVTRPESTGPATDRVRIVGAEPAGESTMQLPVVRGPDEPEEGAEEAEAAEVGAPVAPAADGDTVLDQPAVRLTDVPGQSEPSSHAVQPVAPGQTAVPSSTPTTTELPHWTEPPTGQVPAVLSRDTGEDSGSGSGFIGPTWREEDADWVAHEEEFEPAMFGRDHEALGSLNETDSSAVDRRPWEFDLDPARSESTAGGDAGQPGDEVGTVAPITEPVDVVRSQPDAGVGRAEGDGGHAPAPVAAPAAGVENGGTDASSAGRVPAGDQGDDRLIAGVDDTTVVAEAHPAGEELFETEKPRPTGSPRLGRARRNGLRPARMRAKRPQDADALTDAALAAEPPGASVTDVPGAGRKRGGVAGLAAADRTADREGDATGDGPDEPPAPDETVRDAEAGAARGAAGVHGRSRRRTSGRRPSEGVVAPTGGGPPVPRRNRRTSAEGARGGGGSEPGGSSIGLRVGTGIAVAIVALLAFRLGTVTSLILTVIVVTFAAGECFGVLRRAGYHPATLLGLVGTISLMVGAYSKGIAAIPLVLVLITVFTLVWFLFGIERGSPVAGTAATLLTVGWVSLLGSFAGLLLSPSTFPDRHGIAFLLGAIIATVANDVGALVIGGWLGSRPLAPSISPNKTWEGLMGGAVFSILVSTVVVGAIHPWSPANAALLGVVVAVVAPIGDLCESLLKRDLRLKDMGTLLPGHGGVLDRVDALLFVLPATYYLVRALNIA